MKFCCGIIRELNSFSNKGKNANTEKSAKGLFFVQSASSIPHCNDSIQTHFQCIYILHILTMMIDFI